MRRLVIERTEIRRKQRDGLRGYTDGSGWARTIDSLLRMVIAPWSARIVRCEGGWIAFESVNDYETWQKQR